MKITLTVDDNLYEVYHQLAKEANGKISQEVAMVRRLRQFSDLPLDARLVTLSGASLTALESLLGSRSIIDGADLVSRVKSLAQLEVGSHRVDLSPAQLLVAKQRALKLGMDFDDYLADLLKRVASYLGEELG